MNKNIRTVPFKIEHIRLMDVRTHEVENILCDDDYEEKLKVLTSVAATVTVFYGDKVLCVLGLYEMYKGVCEIWIIPCKIIATHGLIFARIMKKLLNQVWEMGYYHRIQVSALNDDIHNRFFSWLKFDLETPNGMKNFTINKCNYNMWSRTK